MALKFRIAEENSGLLIYLSGDLTFADDESFREIISSLAGKTGSRAIVDLGGLTYIDSAGLGLFLVLKEAVEEVNKKLSIRQAKGQVKEMLEIAEFSSMIPFE